MRLINDLYYVGLTLGRPAGFGYMVYGALAQEPAAFIEGLVGTLAINHLYKSEKKLRNSSHKPSPTNQS